MSGLPTSYESPSRPFRGVQRSSSNARLHNLQRPYSRPINQIAYKDQHPSTSASTSTSNGQGASPFSRALTTRPNGLPRSSSASTLPRSGSESSLGLIGGIKSIFTRPLAWLATPSRAKRDVGDEEDPESPLHDIRSKRVRRRSPSPQHDGQNGDYTPDKRSGSGTFEVTGRAITGNMVKPLIPALPANVSLTARKPHSATTNFSRPLASSRSMPYLDPPSSTLSPARKRSGMLTRSRRMDLASEAGDDDEDDSLELPKNDSDWAPASPWSNRNQVPASPRRPTTPSRLTSSRDFTLPSNSPFKIPVSPSASRYLSGQSSLSRSNTIANIARAPSVAATDISMDNESVKSVRRSGSLLFGGSRGSAIPNGDRDERMSVDSGREGSVTDWFMKGRWDGSLQGRKAPSLRPGSLAPSSGLPPIRRGQLVWDSEKGFVRESELRAAEPAPTASNEAERILFALENRRSTPLQTARSSVPFTQGGPFPADLVGASTRQIRKAINVPLATSQATESLASKRERELQEERSRGVSVLISPYGRRRQADDAVRVARRERSIQRDSEYRQSSERQPSVDEAMSTDSRSSRAPTDASMRSDSEAEAHSSATPRRSSRLRRTDTTPEPDATPRARRSKGKASSSSKRKTSAETTTPKETPRRSSRNRSVERATSPTPPSAHSNLPVITETAPSPQQDKEREGQGYRPLADGGLERGSASLRAGSEKKSRTHQSASNSRANTPGSGRYSAREEDLPPMEELAQPKIPFNSFSGITFSGLNSGTSTPVAQPSEKVSTTASAKSDTLGTGLTNRLGPAPAASKDSSSSLGLPKAGGPLSRLNASRPRASSPLASGSIVAQPESPPAMPSRKSPQPPPTTLSVTNSDGFVPLFGSGSTTPVAKPPSTPFGGFSSNTPTDGSALFGNMDGPKKTLGFGIGKPSKTPEPEVEKESAAPAGIPDFFGSQPPSRTSTPPAAPSFSFGVSTPDPTAVKPAEPVNGGTGFSFMAPKANGDNPADKPLFSFAKPADPAPSSTPSLSTASSTGFSFGQPKAPESAKAPEPAKTPFSFGQPAATKPPPAEPSAKTDKPAFGGFSFSQPSATPAPSETPKETTAAAPSFSFGQPAKKAEEAPKPSFSFGSTSSTPATASETASKPSFAFGQPQKTAAPVNGTSAPPLFGASGTTTPAAPASTGFNFGNASEPAKAPVSAAPASTPFTFGNGSSSFGGPSSTSGFGSSTNAGKRGASESVDEPPPKYSAAGPSSNGFAFGAPASQPNGTGAFGASNTSSTPSFGGFGTQPAATSAPSNPFGSTSTSSFNFGSNPSTPTAAPTSNPFGSTPSNPATTPGGTSFNFTFGGGAAPAPAGGSTPFQFGSSNPPPSNTPTFGAGAPATPSFSFGSTTSAPTPTGSFQFGASASTTPQTAPSFAFGGGGGAGGGAAPAQQQQPRFGSPGPAASPAGDGFNMGAGPMGTPGSPGGRRIKPLRKTAAKR